MKKLMIAAAIVCAAAFAQAATVSWSANNIYERGSTTVKAGNNYVAYFINSASYSLANAKTDLGNGNTDFISTYGVGPSAIMENKGVGLGVGSATITTSAGNNETWTGYIVIVDATSVSDASYAYISAEATNTTGSSGQAATLAFGAQTGTQTASNWYAVPEPTSGLLLLLGVAGLALRRRRA